MRLLDGIQSALNAQGPHAAVTAEVAMVLFIGATVIFVGVMLLAGWAVLGRRRGWLARPSLIVAGGVVFPVIVLFLLLVYTLYAAARIRDLPEPSLRIEVSGKQWWWHVRYTNAEGRPDFVTANEIRIPAGQTVEIALRSDDVLHSFWVPALAGKLDMIPGRENRLRIAADRPGVYRGQCAEYCGGPHALMAFLVIAQSPEEFEAWRAQQRTPAAASRSGTPAGGEKLFLAHCAACHTVRGTPAEGELGPDLTHVGSRLTLAAGILPNNAGTLAGWVSEAQRIKPGNLMPSFGHFSGDELRALAVYLESLK